VTAGPQGEPGSAGDLGTVYLIHLDQRYKHAGHSQHWTRDLTARIAEHLRGQGARLMEVIKDAGITWQVSRTWEGDRNLERAIKNRHEARSSAHSVRPGHVRWPRAARLPRPVGE